MSTEAQMIKSKDRLVRRLSDFKGTVPLGLSLFDWMKRAPAAHFERVRMLGDSHEPREKSFQTHEDELLIIGSACGGTASPTSRCTRRMGSPAWLPHRRTAEHQ